ncbi:YlbF family regulator [Lactococcus formosensis]|uniref:YlbF family regulator n=1 Tax=Lactococcus formosensis TaxID=1281486 RepID=UPI0022E925E6|nr:YlbF family regulator [Lactococcus formosensis]MDT2727350.1 YlbF family regulator [Lactococcus formosensis]
MPYNASKEKLIAHILDLDYVKAFQKAEDALQKEKEVFEQQSKMKELQKEAVLYQKIGKIQAFKETSNAAQRIHKSLKNDPLVEDYLLKMQPVDALLNYVTGEIESKVNEALGHKG